jgi:uncharacterized membrane protein
LDEIDIDDSFDLDNDDLNEEDLEAQIQSAVNELSEEDLQSEVDEETLLDIVASDINDIEALTARDVKIALGEEVEDEEEVTIDVAEENEDLEELEPDVDDLINTQHTIDTDKPNAGVESLKKLLKALSNEEVAASMKGMKININISLGDD